jgi:TolA-binding protein
MSADKRITKRQMKEDKLVSTTFRATEYIQKNKNTFTIALSAAVVVFIVAMLFKWSNDRKRNEAATLYSRADMEIAMGQTDQAIADLQTVVENYGGTPSAAMACLTLANDYYALKQYDNAQKYYEKVLSEYSKDNMLAASAAAGAATCLEMKGDRAAAAKMFMQAADLDPRDLWSPGYLLKAGNDFIQAGDKASAETAFDTIEKKYPNTSESTAARRSLAELR